jgi:DNA-binding MarR family transcriptional regulator
MSARRKSARPSTFDDFLPHLIARLAYELNADLIEKLRCEGINVTRWRILAVLAMGDGITINEIVDRAMMQQSALSRALMNMEREKFVTLFNSLNVVVRRRQKRLLKGFSPREVAATFALMRRLTRNMRN